MRSFLYWECGTVIMLNVIFGGSIASLPIFLPTMNRPLTLRLISWPTNTGAFINKYNKTIYAKEAQLMLGNLYSLRKNYTQARLEYQKAICPNKELSAQAEATIAKTYELEGNWDKALTIYKSVIQDYPLTSTGFFIPMYLTNHVQQLKAKKLIPMRLMPKRWLFTE